MKALFLEGEKQLSLAQINTPRAGVGETSIKIEITGIGGSEYQGYRAPGIRSLPNIMGHGFAGYDNDGRRVAINPVRGCGACAYCGRGYRQLCDDWNLIGVQSNGGFAEYAVVPKDALVELPNRLSWEQAAFVEPFANSVNAWSMSGAHTDSRVAILGAGSLGLGLVACAIDNGCGRISALDTAEARMTAAREIGAQGINMHETYDIVFDTVGTSETRNMAMGLTAKLGTCVWMGFSEPSHNIVAGELIRSQRRVIGAFAYSNTQFSQAIKLACYVQKSWVSNLSFEDVEAQLEAYRLVDFSTIKAALRPFS